jgi:hypothetical protein
MRIDWPSLKVWLLMSVAFAENPIDPQKFAASWILKFWAKRYRAIA